MKIKSLLFSWLLCVLCCTNIIGSEPDEQKNARNATFNYCGKPLPQRIMEHVKTTLLQLTESDAQIENLKQQAAEKAMAAYLDICDLIDRQPSNELIKLREKIVTHLRKLGHEPVTSKSKDINSQWQWNIFRHCTGRRSCNLFNWLQLIPAEKLDAIERYFDEIPFRSSL